MTSHFMRLLLRQAPRIIFYGGLLLAGLMTVFFRHELLRAAGVKGWQSYQNVREVVARYRPAVEQRFRPICDDRDIPWPPERLVLLAFKQERKLEVWVAGDEDPFVRLATYPVLGMSGGPGPKRRSSDLQVPEGIYDLPVLNPNSQHHLSIRVDYPNETDLAHAEVPREKMGGDIYVHGGQASIGCLALGDPAIEEVFTLAALVGSERRLIVSPVDFRRAETRAPPAEKPWIAELYSRLAETLQAFPVEG